MRRANASRTVLACCLAALLAALLAAGCSDQGTAPLLDGDGGGSASISYAADIQPLWDAACLGCHGQNGNGGLDLRGGVSRGNMVGVPSLGYAQQRVAAGNADASVLYLKLTGASGTGAIMPVGGSLDQAEIDKVRAWIDEGALDN